MGFTLLIIFILDLIQKPAQAIEERNKPMSVHELHCLILNELGFDEQECLQVLAALRQQSVRRVFELFEIKEEALWKFRAQDAFDENEERALSDLHQKLKTSTDLAENDFAELRDDFYIIHEQLVVLKDNHKFGRAKKTLEEFSEINGIALEEEQWKSQIGIHHCYRLYPR